MSRYILATSRHNKFYERFVGGFRRVGLDFACYYYEDFDYDENQKLRYKGKAFRGFLPEDVVYMRASGYFFSEELNFMFREVAQQAVRDGSRVLDDSVWMSYPHNIDKYTQALRFARIGIPHVETVVLSRVGEGWDKYPVIVKPRVGAGGKGSRVIDSYGDLQRYKEEVDAGCYICQPFMRVRRDLRVLVVGGEIVGAVRRAVKVYEDCHVGVKAVEKVELSEVEKKIVDKFIEDKDIFIRGVDLLTDVDQYTWVGEVNVSPIFNAFERLTGIDVVEKIINAMEQVSKE